MTVGAKRGRDQPCPCGSGHTFDTCHGAAATEAEHAAAKVAPRSSASAESAESVAERLSNLAEGHFRVGRYEDAIEPLLQAHGLFPNNPAIIHNLGVAYQMAGRLQEALPWLRQSIALQPDD